MQLILILKNHYLDIFVGIITLRVKIDPFYIRKDLQACMQKNFSVFREGNAMSLGLLELKDIRERLLNSYLKDRSFFNI